MIKKEEIRILKNFKKIFIREKKERLIKEINELIEILQEFFEEDEVYRETIKYDHIEIRKENFIVASDYNFKNIITLNDLPLDSLVDLKNKLQEKIKIKYGGITEEIQDLLK